MSRRGIDVSYANGRIDWRRAKDDGVHFAMIRAGFGNGHVDSEFHRNIRECNRYRVPAGAYWFSYAYTKEMARQEARYCIRELRRHRVDYPVAFDFEEDSIAYAREQGVDVTRDFVTELTKEFCDEIRRARYHAMYYSNLSDLEEFYDREKLKDYEFWLAKYSDILEVPDVDMWQHSSQGRIRGIDGYVDLDYSYKDYEKREVKGKA